MLTHKRRNLRHFAKLQDFERVLELVYACVAFFDLGSTLDSHATFNRYGSSYRIRILPTSMTLSSQLFS